jgi:cytochrome c biogenesis protein CcdA
MEFGDLVQRISDSVSFPLLSAFLIGIMAAISPCPLATNISAMAYISRNVTDRRHVITLDVWSPIS